jgi:hypothetical protein
MVNGAMTKNSADPRTAVTLLIVIAPKLLQSVAAPRHGDIRPQWRVGELILKPTFLAALAKNRPAVRVTEGSQACS